MEPTMSIFDEGKILLALDIGGTKTAAAIITAGGEILSRFEEPTNQEGPQKALQQFLTLLRGRMDAYSGDPGSIFAVGVGIPAVLDPVTDHVLWGPNLSGWRDVPLGKTLSDALGLPVAVEYDGHTAVLGEWWKGAGQGVQSLVDIIIGTGIGGGILLDGKLVRGINRLAGAAGWLAMTSDPAQDPSMIDSPGHWESMAAGPGILMRARALAEKFPESHLYYRFQQEEMTTKTLFDAARAGDELSLEIIEETAGIIGLGLASIISLLNPERIVLGGSIGSQGDLLLEGARAAAVRWAQPYAAASVEIVSSTLGADAGLLGAAYAAVKRFG